MKKTIALVLVGLLCISVLLTGCSSNSRNLKEELPGKWEIWHWYYNVDNGESGFFDSAMYCEFKDGKISVTSTDGAVIKEGTFAFTGDDTLDVEYSDGTTASIQLIASNHDGVDQIQFMDVNNKYTLTLELINDSGK